LPSCTKEGWEDELRENLIDVVERSRRYEGHLRYELFVQQDDRRRFVFVEHWASQQAQERHHLESQHIRRFETKGAGAVEKVDLFYQLDRVGQAPARSHGSTRE
jgi:quinol monooxygenase YgiN